MLADFCLVAKNGRRILDNNGSPIFLLVTTYFLLAKKWSHFYWWSQKIGRKKNFRRMDLVASKFSSHKNGRMRPFFGFATKKKNLWYTSSKYQKILKKFKGHFRWPSNPSVPSNSACGLACRCSHWTPKGRCRYTGSFVHFLYKPIKMLFTISKITPRTCVSKANFQKITYLL